MVKMFFSQQIEICQFEAIFGSSQRFLVAISIIKFTIEQLDHPIEFKLFFSNSLSLLSLYTEATW